MPNSTELGSVYVTPGAGLFRTTFDGGRGFYEKALETVWEAATPQERRQMIQTLLQAVYLDCERGPVVSIEPKPEYKVLFEMGEEAK